ncbi:mitochondrial 37S ribosomal protein uS17m MRPS17 [Sporobolomyces koalae]|uniref:mitochondrial 37S ribosomal protein uS17m MRPS17 n=1 Tax=Sporobolomyces koalae TaxID=500713 RepID=UPI003181EA49
MSFRTGLQSASRLFRPCTCSTAPLRSLSTTSSRFAQLPPPASQYTLPKGLELVGKVINHGKIKQTITVSVERRMTDHKTLKEFKKHSKYLVHDPEQHCVSGDEVKIRNCRPVSARKRFELVSVIKGARERTESAHGPGEVNDATTTVSA